MPSTYTQKFHIASYQTDVTARIKPSAILEMMQEVAGAHAEALGVGRSSFTPRNLAWVLTRVEVCMERYPLSSEVVTVETFPMPNRRVFFPRYYLFRDSEGKQIGCAGSLWVILDVTTRKMANASEIVALMPDNSALTAPMGMPATVEEVGGKLQEAFRTPVYTDLDMNGHVNNTRYLDWCCNELGIDTMRRSTLRQFAVNFNQEILPGQVIRTALHRDGERFSFSGFEGDIRHFDVGGVLSAE